MQQLLYASEHYQDFTLAISDEFKHLLVQESYNRIFGKEGKDFCFQILHQEGILSINSSYYIGVDWIEKEKVALYIEPKLNSDNQVNFLSMLIESLEASENMDHLDGLFDIKFEESWIIIPQQKDLLSPILVVHFLKLLKLIIKKGLKKSYYVVTKSLKAKVKGKILVSNQIKKNILQNRKTINICEYQEYGANFLENQFLKTVLSFVKKYLSVSDSYFSPFQKRQLNEILDYCMPAFASVDQLKDIREEPKVRNNVFFRDYKDAVRIGGFILKRFSYNINKFSVTSSLTPPFWIDMSRLFELYVFGKLRTLFPVRNDLTYHDRYMGGKETDILIRAKNFEGVVDCKYKPRYFQNNPSLEDKRQLAGYTRLKSVYKKLSKTENEVIRGLIIFSSQECDTKVELDDLYSIPIDEYVGFFKLGIALPEL